MSEVRIRENESLESALKRFKRSAPVVASSRKSVSVNITKSPASSARKRLKPLASASGNQNVVFELNFEYAKTLFHLGKGFFFLYFTLSG